MLLDKRSCWRVPPLTVVTRVRYRSSVTRMQKENCDLQSNDIVDVSTTSAGNCQSSLAADMSPGAGLQVVTSMDVPSICKRIRRVALRLLSLC